MTNTRNMALEASFMIFYIGLISAMVAISATLSTFLALGFEFGPSHVAAAAVNLAGWVLLPFLPRVYRAFVGQRFSWRDNGIIGEM